MECPFCKKEMVKGRISVLDRANYSFYPEEYYGNALKRLANQVRLGELAASGSPATLA